MKQNNFRWLLFLAAVFLCLPVQASRADSARHWPHLERRDGEKRDVVKAIQYLLRSNGHDLVVDGIFGNQTAYHVKIFQRKHNLVDNGEMNDATWEALVKRVKRGSRGDAVRAAQSQLRRYGYDIPVDGIYGSATEKAVRRFQKQQGRHVDGIVGTYTWVDLVGGHVAD